MTPDLENLARHVRRRRQQMGWSQMHVWKENAGPSNTKLTDIESAKGPAPSPSTQAKLDRGMRWQPGSTALVLEGGQPVEMAVDELPIGILEPGGDANRKAAVAAFDKWVQAYVQMLSAEWEYQSAIGDRGWEVNAHEELEQIFYMAQQLQDGRPWTPPWMDWSEEYGEGAEPWLEEWWLAQANLHAGMTVHEAIEQVMARMGRPVKKRPRVDHIFPKQPGADRPVSVVDDTVGDLVAAHEEEGSISAEQEESDTP